MRKAIYGVATLVILLLGYTGWISYRMASEANKDEVRPAEVIIVLGSVPQADGQPTTMLRGRVEHGVALYQQGWAPRLMLAGGVVHDRANQAQVMAKVAAEMGVSQQAIIREGRSRTTLESVRFSKEIMAQEGLRSALVVTSPFHMARALRMYGDAGVTVSGSPARHSEDNLPKWTRWLYWARELGATTLYYLSLSP